MSEVARTLFKIAPHDWHHRHANPMLHAQRASKILDRLYPKTERNEKTIAAFAQAGYRLLTSNIVLVNGSPRSTEASGSDLRTWAELEGIAFNDGDMTMTADQAFAFRMRFE